MSDPLLTTYRRLKACIIAVDVTVFLTASALMMYWAVTESGLVGLLLDLELRFLGWASIKFSAFVAFILMWLPGYVLSDALLRPLKARRDAIEARMVSGGSLTAAEAGHDPLFDPITSISGLRRMRTWSLVALVGGLTLTAVSIAAYEYRGALFSPDPESYRAQPVDLAAGEPARFVSASGVALAAVTYTWEEGRSGSRRKHEATPLVPRTWRKGEPIRYFVVTRGEATPKRTESMYATTIEGEITRNGLPTFVTAAYQREKFPLADPYYVIRPGLSTPDSDYATVSVWGAIAGAVIALMALVFCVVALTGLRKRKDEVEQLRDTERQAVENAAHAQTRIARNAERSRERMRRKLSE